MDRRTPLVCLALLFAGCNRSGAGESHAAHGSRTSAPTPNPVTTGATALVIRGEVVQSDAIAPILEAHGTSPVRIGASLAVEVESNGNWSAVDVRGLTLRADCASTAPTCIELVHGGGLRPPPWNGRTGSGQCTSATDGSPVAEGDYRFVATTCEGGERIVGETFRIAR